MYESRRHAPLTRRLFIRRLVFHLAVLVLLMLVSLAIGMAGYGYYEKLGWREAFLNAAMLLGGMGPVDAPRTDHGKVFEGLYALYAGLVFMVASGLMAAPFLHRLLHKFHWEQDK